MASVLAIVSRKIFERDFRIGGQVATLGDVVATAKYTSAQRTLERLAEGGNLYLITVAPGEQLWLVGVLEAPRFEAGAWTATANATPITDITPLLPKLVLENGNGITARPGALAMSLQTPRVLAASDVALLSTGDAAVAAPAAPAPRAVKPRPFAKGAPAITTPPAPKAVVPAGTGLAHVATLLERGALAAALDELLRLWGSTRASALTAAIDTLGLHIARALPPIVGKPLNGAWFAVADQHRSIDVPRLVSVLGDAPNSKVLKGWLERLARFPRDPRIGVAAVEAVPVYVSSSAGPMRTVAFRLAKQMGDRATCQEAVSRMVRKVAGAWNADDLRARLHAILDELPEPAALSAADAETLAAVQNTIDKLVRGAAPTDSQIEATGGDHDDTSARLLQAVLDDPASDGPRLVYGDHLQELGDPRGELLTLQLQEAPSPEEQKRIAELVSDPLQVASWLGPLNAIVSKPVFARGFLQKCTIELATPAQRALLAHPWFATVEEVECNDAAPLTSPAMKSLRRLTGATAESLAALLDTPRLPAPVTSLRGVSYERTSRRAAGNLAVWQRLVTVGPFTGVTDLGLRLAYDDPGDPAALDWFFGSPLARQLESLEVYVNDPPLARWLGVFRTHPKLQTVALRFIYSYTDAGMILVRQGDQFAFTFEAANSVGFDAARYARMFDGFPTKAVPELQLVCVKKALKSKAKARAAAREVLGRFVPSIVDVD